MIAFPIMPPGGRCSGGMKFKDLPKQKQIKIIDRLFNKMPVYKKEIYYKNFGLNNYWH